MKQVLYIIYQVCVALPIMLAATLIAALFTIVGSLFNSRFWGYWPGMIWGRLFYRIFLIPVHIEGEEHIHKGESYVIAANHQSYWDAFLIYGFMGVPFKWIMKSELMKIPFVGWACYMAGHIFIDRSSRVKSMESIQKAETRIKDGMSVVIFPEGTRTHNGRMSRFKRGAFLISQELTLPILPVTIDGNYRVMSRHAWFVTWNPVRMTIHEPVMPVECNGLTEQERAQVMNSAAQKVSDIIEAALD